MGLLFERSLLSVPLFSCLCLLPQAFTGETLLQQPGISCSHYRFLPLPPTAGDALKPGQWQHQQKGAPVSHQMG